MRVTFLGAVLLGLVIGLSVAGVRCVMRDSSGDGVEAAAPDKPAPAGSPRATADEWATAWTAGNTNALYQLLEPATQAVVPSAAFLDDYSSFEIEFTLRSLTATVLTAQDGRAELAVKATTAYFGQMEYTIALNLVETPGRWLVAWDRAAIHPDLGPGRSARSTIQRPVRGAILDRDGVQLAVTQDIRMVGLNRALVTDRDAVIAALANFGISADTVNAAFAAPGGPQQRIPVAPISDAQAADASTQLRAIPGVLLFFESRRVHPLGAAGAQVIGYTRELTAEELEKRAGTGYRAGDRVGAAGLEEALEESLAGRIGGELVVVDAAGDPVKTLATSEYVAPKDVKTTLDADVLATAQQRLGERVGSAVVMDPTTNAILAIVSSPSFDPDAFERNDAAALAAITSAAHGPLVNRATGGTYSAGSTFKLITGAAGLIYGGYSVGDTIFCGAIWDGVDPPRRNWEGTQGPLTIAGGLMRSCNPVFYEIGLKLYDTDNLLSQMAREFGFGAPTGVVGIADEAGLVPDAAWKKEERNEPWYPGDDVNLAIGQGDLLITPLQLANAYTTFITKQLRMPVLLEGETATKKGDIALTDAQWNHLMQGLRLVTSPTGTASAAFANAGYTNFAGKSGTAEDAGTQQHVLFVAFAPASAPAAVAAVVLDDGESGSIEAGPIARDIVLAAME
ncbi:MAG: hypothetical protein IT303_02990 [Dehalococcoidia bacterium]|nr:hypothetical protein [Dehalococcoidia bacterium]